MNILYAKRKMDVGCHKVVVSKQVGKRDHCWFGAWANRGQIGKDGGRQTG